MGKNKMQIILYDKQINNEHIRVQYNPATECIGFTNYYIDVEQRKQYKHGYRQNHKEALKQKIKEYQQTERGKEVYRNSGKKYRCTHREKEKRRYKKYSRTEAGKKANKKRNAKHRKLGFIPLMSNPFPEEIPVDYHHINNVFVIPIPRQVHKNMLGKNHRREVNNWIEEYIGLIGV